MAPLYPIEVPIVQGRERPEESGGNMNHKHTPKRFGVIAVEKGFVTKEQVADALKLQVMEEIEKREHRFIGRILLEQRLINISQIDEVFATMRTRPVLE